MSEYRNRSRPGAARMTRAHFEAIAGTLRELRPAGGSRPGSVVQWRESVAAFEALCRGCYQGGAGFDGGRFRRAAGLE